MSTSASKAKPSDPISLVGTSGPDRLRGSEGDDRLQGLQGNDHLRGQGGNDWLVGGPGNDRIWGGDGNDRLQGQDLATGNILSDEVNIMRGGAGDDSYLVNGPGDRVIEKAGEGIDVINTSIGMTLPDHVEDLVAYYVTLLDNQTLVGNALDNRISGAPSSYETIRGLDGNDTLDGGTRVGAFLDGGNGDDTLILTFGESLGGAGADLFVAGGRGAMTAPDTPITVLDFNAAEGDRLHIVSGTSYDAAELLESGQLRFEADTGRLILDFDRSTTGPLSVDQVFVLSDVQQFNPDWLTIGML